MLSNIKIKNVCFKRNYKYTNYLSENLTDNLKLLGNNKYTNYLGENLTDNLKSLGNNKYTNYLGENLNENLKSLGDNKYTNYLSENLTDDLKSLGNGLKHKTDDLVEASFDKTLNNLIKMVKTTENRIKFEKVDNVEINVCATVGPISLSISKKILLE
jgi:hypothetical protein